MPKVNDYGGDLDGVLNSLMRVVCPAPILCRHRESKRLHLVVKRLFISMAVFHISDPNQSLLASSVLGSG